MGIYLNIDCMDRDRGLPSYPDNHFDLCICDPPYGTNLQGGTTPNNGFKSGELWAKARQWDNRPTAEYFYQLFRVSKHQIIWGANYYPQHLVPSMGWLFWDKGQRDFTFADGELAFTSFDRALRVFSFSRGELVAECAKYRDGKIHPTQKPMALYRWLLTNYAKQGMRLLDTHVGSASSLVVFEEMGFDYVAYEIDRDYYEAGNKRLEAFRKQGSLFTPQQVFEASSRQMTLGFED